MVSHIIQINHSMMHMNGPTKAGCFILTPCNRLRSTVLGIDVRSRDLLTYVLGKLTALTFNPCYDPLFMAKQF